MYSGVSTDVALVLMGAASQSANLQEWRDSNGTTLAVVSAAGYMGIGASSASFPLDVQATVNSNQSYGYLNSLGNVGTASGTNSYSIRATGRVLASDFNAVSDARLKDVQFSLDSNVALHAITQLNPVSFVWKSNPTGQPILGFLAQEVEQVIPNAVSKIATNNFSDQRELSYNQIVAVAVGAIKQQASEITALQQQVTSLQGLNSLSGATPIVLQAQLYLSGDSVGEAKILAGATSVRIAFSKPYEQQPIVTVTPESRVGGEYWVADKDASGFTIYREAAGGKDAIFDWHAFASPNAQLQVSDGTSLPVQLIMPAPVVSVTTASGGSTVQPIAPAESAGDVADSSTPVSNGAATSTLNQSIAPIASPAGDLITSSTGSSDPLTTLAADSGVVSSNNQ